MTRLLRDLRTSLIALVAVTLSLGLAYPIVITGVAQVVWPNKAGGSQITRDGRPVASKLLAQPFKPAARYFQPRPSQDDYDPSATFFANLGPNQRSTAAFLRGATRDYLRRERPYDPGLTVSGVPVDAVTHSASGLDPDISKANARIQAHRVAAARHLPPATVDHLIDEHTTGRFLGLVGEPGVNVTTLNLDLSRLHSGGLTP